MSNINKTKANTIKLAIVVLIATGYVSSVIPFRISEGSGGSIDSPRSVGDQYDNINILDTSCADNGQMAQGNKPSTLIEFFNLNDSNPSSCRPSTDSTVSSRSSLASGSSPIVAYQGNAVAVQNNDVMALFQALSLREGQNFEGHQILAEILENEEVIKQIIEVCRNNSRNLLSKEEHLRIRIMINRYGGLMNYFMSIRSLNFQGHRLFQERLNELQDSVPDYYFGKKSNSSVLHSWRLQWSTKLYPEGHVEDLGEQVIDDSDYSSPNVIIYYNPYHKDADKSQRERCIHFTIKIGDIIFGLIPTIHVQDDDENHMVQVHFGTLAEEFSELPSFLARKGIFLLQDREGSYARPPLTDKGDNALLEEKVVRAFHPINGIAVAAGPVIQLGVENYKRTYRITDNEGYELHLLRESASNPNALTDTLKVNYGPGHLISSLIRGTLEIEGDLGNPNLLDGIVVNLADDAIVLQTTDSPQGSDLDITSPTPGVGSSEFSRFSWPSQLSPIQSGDGSEASSSKDTPLHTSLPLSPKEDISSVASPSRQRLSYASEPGQKQVVEAVDTATSPMHFSIADDVGTQTDLIAPQDKSTETTSPAQKIESDVSTQTDHKAGRDMSTETASGPAQEKAELSAETKTEEFASAESVSEKITSNDNHISSGVLIKPTLSTLESHHSMNEGFKNTTNLAKSDASEERATLKMSNMVSELISLLRATYNLFV